MSTPLIDATGVPILEISIDQGTPGVVTNTMNILTLPINCVLMGDQPEPGPINSEVLKRIFRDI